MPFQQRLIPGTEWDSRPTLYGAAPTLTPGSENSSCSPAGPGEELGWPVPSPLSEERLRHHIQYHMPQARAPHFPGASGIHALRCQPSPMAETCLQNSRVQKLQLPGDDQLCYIATQHVPNAWIVCLIKKSQPFGDLNTVSQKPSELSSSPAPHKGVSNGLKNSQV